MQFLPTLVGNSFRDSAAQGRLADLNLGDELRLERDPSNEYDPNAVKVLTPDGLWLGFIDKGNAPDIARILDKMPSAVAEGHEPVATVTVYDQHNPRKPVLLVEITTGYEVETTVREAE